MRQHEGTLTVKPGTRFPSILTEKMQDAIVSALNHGDNIQVTVIEKEVLWTPTPSSG